MPTTTPQETSLAKPPSKSERTRQRLLDETIKEIVDVGVDRLSFTSVAKRASLTTGSLYSRYENQSELLVDVWESRCEPSLHQFLAVIAESLTGDGQHARVSLAQAMNNPSEELLAAIEILVVSRRLDEMGEVVIPWLVSEMRTGTLKSETDQFQYIVALVLGSLLVLFGNTKENLDWTEFCQASFRAWSMIPPTTKVELPSLTLDLSDGQDMDSFDFRLIQATLDIVAKTGLERATVSRIARRSGVNPASLYQHHADKEALLMHAMSRAVAQSIKSFTSANLSLLSKPDVDFHEIAMATAMSLLAPQHKRTRQIRLELHVASAHSRKMSEFIEKQTAAVLENDVRLFKEYFSHDYEGFRPFALALRGLISGLALLQELGVLDSKVMPSFVVATDVALFSKLLSPE